MIKGSVRAQGWPRRVGGMSVPHVPIGPIREALPSGTYAGLTGSSGIGSGAHALHIVGVAHALLRCLGPRTDTDDDKVHGIALYPILSCLRFPSSMAARSTSTKG